MRFIFVSLTACAVALSVAGCGSTTTGAQQEANRIKSVAADYKAAGMDCQQKIAANPDYAPLKAKTSIDTPPQFALQMLNDKTLPTKKEIALLYRVYSDGQECRKIYLDGASNMSPLVHSVLVENYAAAEKLWAQATAGRLTWGNLMKAARTWQLNIKHSWTKPLRRSIRSFDKKIKRKSRNNNRPARQQSPICKRA